MEEESLYHFIHSLDRGQQYNLSTSFKNKESKEYILFNRIRKCKVWDDATRQKVREGLFKHASEYYTNRVKLAMTIVRSLVYFEKNHITAFAFVEKAVQMRQTGLAEKMLVEMVGEFQKREDYLSLLYLHDLRVRMNRRYSARLGWPEESLSSEELDLIVREGRVLDGILDQLRGYAAGLPEDIFTVTGEIRGKLRGIEATTVENRYKVEKVRFACAFLEKRLNLAVLIMEQIIQKYPPGPSVSFIEHVKDVSNLIRVAGDLGDRSTMMKYPLYLATLSPGIPIERDEFKMQKMSNTLFVAKKLGNLDYAKIGQDILNSSDKPIMSTEREISLRYAIAIAYFLNCEWSLAKSELTTLYNIKGILRHPLQWEIFTLYAITKFELGFFEEAERILRSSYRASKKTNFQYASKIISVIKKFFLDPYADNREILQNGIQKLKHAEISANPNLIEMRFSVWLEYKKGDQTPTEIIQERELLKFTSLFRNLGAG